MQLIYLSITLLLLWLHLAALTAVAGSMVGSWSIGRAGAVLMVVLSGFFVEHFYGLGALHGWWPLTTVAAVTLLWLRRQQLVGTGFWQAEVVLILAFGYGLIWRLGFPSIYPSSEHVTDLYFIGNYLAGETLPPLDHWFPPYRFDFYYALQHYGAALLGRWFQLSPGLIYNVSFALLTALSLTLAWSFTQHFVQHKAARLLLVAALAVGGTGASLFTYLVIATPENAQPNDVAAVIHERMWGSARFVGNYDQRGNTELAATLFPKTAGGFIARDLPLENFGYQYYVGDYHPPLGGFFLLLLALAIMAVLQQPATSRQHERKLQVLLALSVPAAIATNTWVFPLQAVLVGGWALWRQWLGRCESRLVPDWPALFAGGIGGLLVLYPFLSGFAARSSPTPLRWVTAQDMTPLLPFLALVWPLLILMVLGLFLRESRRIGLLWVLVFGGLLVFSQVVFIDDSSGDQYQRTNTVMKWWGWIWTGGLVTLGALGLGSTKRWARWGAAFALAGTLVYGLSIAQYWRVTEKQDFGRLAADGVYTNDAAARDMFRFLAVAPDGIVLENSYGDSYSDSDVYAAFAAKPSLLGWPLHLITWHGAVDEVWLRRDQIRAFYAGTLSEPSVWLLANDVRYIVWNARDAKTIEVWKRWADALQPAYYWRPFGNVDGKPVGLWVRQ